MKKFSSLDKYDLVATVKLVETEFSGRTTPVLDNYRGQFFWHINGEPCIDWLAYYIFEHGKLHPGESSKCKIILAGTIKELGNSQFTKGAQYAVREGAKIVAIGSILEVNSNA